MKRFMICTLIFTLFAGPFIPLFAYNDRAKKTVNKYWAACLAEDEDGPLSAEAKIVADIDYPGEGDDWIERFIHRQIASIRGGYGIEYHASAFVSKERHLTVITEASMTYTQVSVLMMMPKMIGGVER